MALLLGSDNFFAGEPNLVAVFDIDYDLVIDFNSKIRWIGVGICLPFSVFCCAPCFLRKNVEWETNCQHVAVTQDGIKYVADKHPSQCGLSCSDVGKVSKTVPFDKITDCDIQEPAGTACCCCIPNVITKVIVDTASSGTGQNGLGSHELVLEGLKDPVEFKRMVWDLKSGRHGAAAAPISNVAQLTAAPKQQDMNTALLQKIYDELRTLNATMARGQ